MLLSAWGLNCAADLPLQTEREKANAVEMHNTFQQELMKLRLMTAKAYVKVMSDGQVGTQGSQPICMRSVAALVDHSSNSQV